MLRLQASDYQTKVFRFWDRISLRSETKRNDECDDATLDVVSTTDVDGDEARSCLQQLVMEDKTEHSHLTWETVQSELMTTLATLQKESMNPTLPRFDSDDDDDDFDALRVLYHGSYGGIAEEECVPLRNRFVDALAEKQRYDFCCEMIQNECRDLFLYHNIWDVRIHKSLVVLLISQSMAEEECGYSLHVEDAIRTVASFLIDPSILVDMKLAFLQILLLPQLSRMGFDDESSTSAFGSRPEKKRMNCPIDGIGGSIVLQQQILREVYAFCVAICFGVNELEYALGASITGGSGPLVSPMLWELRSSCLYLQEVHSIFYDVANSRLLSKAVTAGKVGRSEKQWEQVKCFLFETDSIMLKDLDVLRSLYNILGVRHVTTLASVGYLRIHFSSNLPADMTAQPKYYDALHNVAQFLVDWKVPDRQKFAVLKCLQWSVESTEVTDRNFFRKVLSFCVDRKASADSFSLTSDCVDREMDTCAYYLLLWDLRILCGHYSPQQRLQNILGLLWMKALPRVRVAMHVAGRMKHSFGATLVSSAERVLSK